MAAAEQQDEEEDDTDNSWGQVCPSFHDLLPDNKDIDDNEANYQEARSTHQYTAYIMARGLPTIPAD